MSTTGGSDREHNKHVGQVSTIMKALTNKDEYLLSFFFDKNDESQAGGNNTSSKHLLVNNHDMAANEGRNKCQQALENNFGICRTLKNY